MASTSSSYLNITPDNEDEEEDTVVVECRDLDHELDESDLREITISTSEIGDWNLSAILTHHIVKIKASRKKLIEQSSYFRGLLSGSFSESSNQCVIVNWGLSTFLQILTFIYEGGTEITVANFIPLLQTGLYFGVEILLSECKTWFSDKLSCKAVSPQLQLDDLLLFWNYGIEQGMNYISGLCTSYVARNFMRAMSSDNFVDVTYDMLFSSIKHPHLTVQSERHLAEAILSWIYAHVEEPKYDDNIEFDWINIIQQIRADALPLWFLMGKQNCKYFSKFAVQSTDVILSQLQRPSVVSTDMQQINDLNPWRIRLTEFSENVNLSGCPQINATNLMFSLHPSCSWNSFPRESLMPTYQMIPFNSVVELDLSKCPNLHLSTAFEFLPKAFPSLRTMKATYLMDFKTKDLQKLVANCSSLDEVDLRVDIGPIVPSQASILCSESQNTQAPRTNFGPAFFPYKQRVSMLRKLTLRGRTDVNDDDLHTFSDCFVSLCYLDIKCCFSVTDVGISNFLIRSTRLHSLIASDTLFGKHSTAALCNRLPNSESVQLLHIGGCKGVEESSLSEFFSQAHKLMSLCVRDISVVDNALCNFIGSSLKKLNVSNTMISLAILLNIINKSSNLKCLKTRNCKNLSQHNKANDLLSLQWSKELSIKLGKTCNLEKFTIGWCFSFFSLDSLAPSIRSLRSITVGLGGSLGEKGLVLLTKLCPELESVSLLFQEVSDDAVIKLMKRLRNLRVLELCYCMGDLSSQSFKFSVPSLRKLKLERVTPLMTNEELTLLTQKFPALMELSLIGCKCLDADSQQIISNGWPGLISLCMEECGGTTSRGVCSLLNCKALEKLLLRHNGGGIKKNFILEAAMKLPMLRNISLDWCDANEGDLDLPSFGNKGYLNCVSISRCKVERCGFEVQNVKLKSRKIHKETLVLVWNSMGLQRTLVKERI